eukprot:m.283786 g.283786  ORF g.283786 m.283786 type:complete len:91 (+) comp27009_c1_seq2:3034-3306(+)
MGHTREAVAAGATSTSPMLRPYTGDRASNSAAKDTLLVMQHSMSHRLCIASLVEFIASNLQLLAVDESRFAATKFDLADQLIICRGLMDT